MIAAKEPAMGDTRYRLVLRGLLCAFCGWTVAAVGAEPITWDFQSDTAAWQPRGKSIHVERLVTVGPNGKQTPSLHVHGRIEDGWNYANSNPVPMTAGKLYRLSAWVRVDRVDPGTPKPYLKCEFQSADRKRDLGRVNTETYDLAQSGKWQHLRGEFRAPEATQSCWLALEKGTNSPAAIDACLADIRLETIERFGFWNMYRLKPLPASLQKVRGVHPRIYLTSERVAELREAIKTTHAASWKKVREQADRAARQGPPAYVLHDRYSGDEQLWQRSVGNTMPVLAMAYVLTGEKRYLDAARQWALASCGYKTWGLGRIDGMDLATGHQLFGLAIIYDWCYDGLDEAARQQIRETLVKRTSAMFEAAATGKAWWHRSYLQNHLWVNITGMAAAGFALFDEVDDATCWIGLPLDKYRRTMAALGPDGASHEGVGYWEYGVEYMLKFMDLARQRLDVDFFDCPWWRKTAAYPQYLALPRNAWTRDNCIVDLADCPRGHWYGPEYLLRCLARQYRDGHAQWLAQQIDNADVASAEASWLNLIWFDPSVPVKSPEARPTLHHFEDMGLVSARSAWSGDESLVVFKCGPFIGREAVAKFSYDPGGGHVHPDANHFVLFGGGQWLIRDDGYHPKWTEQHNTLLVNGRGQYGEGAEWFNGSQALAQKVRPRILRAETTNTIDHITGDATEAYPRELGLKRFVRHLVFVKPDVLIVADDILLDKEASLELRFHPEQQTLRDGNVFVAKGKQATLRLEPLATEGVQIAGEPVPLPGRHGEKESSMFTIRLSTRQPMWRNAVALSWSAAGKEPTKVILRAVGQKWTFAVKDQKLTLDWMTGKIE
jgi:hypothetical protein